VKGTLAGGLVGINSSSSSVPQISDSYASATVTGSDSGGLVGENNGTITSGFWNTSLGGATGVAVGTATGATGLGSSAMMNISSFSGWSIADVGGSGDIWRIYDGETMPLLLSFLAPVSASASDVSVAYTASAITTVPTYTTSISGAILLGTATISSTSSHVNAGSYSFSIDGGLYSNQQGYDISYGSGQATLTITPATLTASLAGTVSKTYNANTTATLGGGNYT
jgi:hypothetical protein